MQVLALDAGSCKNYMTLQCILYDNEPLDVLESTFRYTVCIENVNKHLNQNN